MAGLKYLYKAERVDQHGRTWVSWILRIDNGLGRIFKSFSERKFGSQSAALAEAVACRDHYLRLRRFVVVSKCHRTNTRNKSGYVGISELNYAGRQIGWRVPYNKNGKRTARHFLFRNHGVRGALSRARYFRFMVIGDNVRTYSTKT